MKKRSIGLLLLSILACVLFLNGCSLPKEAQDALDGAGDALGNIQGELDGALQSGGEGFREELGGLGEAGSQAAENIQGELDEALQSGEENLREELGDLQDAGSDALQNIQGELGDAGAAVEGAVRNELENAQSALSDGQGSGNGAGSREISEDGYYTTKEDVALYLRTYGKLPPNFITKKEAKALGWEGGGLDEFLDGGCIGGDRFGNYEGLLPEKDGLKYYECDIDTMHKSKRGKKRLIYSSEGKIYYTGDHYQSFEELKE